jgi:peptidoglycan/xylan/chitin deacetylase (PgdA/CDA1 family)
VAGVRPRYFRFPGGCETAADIHLVAALHEQPVQWDVDSGDAFQPDPQVIVRQVLRAARPGSIIVAHCIGAPNTPATARAMAILIPRLRAEGYRFVTLATLLRRA